MKVLSLVCRDGREVEFIGAAEPGRSAVQLRVGEILFLRKLAVGGAADEGADGRDAAQPVCVQAEARIVIALRAFHVVAGFFEQDPRNREIAVVREHALDHFVEPDGARYRARRCACGTSRGFTGGTAGSS